MQIFDDLTREDISAVHIKFIECESSMYWYLRTFQPEIPASSADFSEMLPKTIIETFYKFTVSSNYHINGSNFITYKDYSA